MLFEVNATYPPMKPSPGQDLSDPNHSGPPRAESAHPGQAPKLGPTLMTQPSMSDTAAPDSSASAGALPVHQASALPTASASRLCPNCARPLAQPLPNFCGHCGQETKIAAPTLFEFAQQFGGAYFSTEGALWRTLRLLLTRPGQLTLDYFAGRRRHYVLPLRLYLTISLLALLLIRLAGALQPDDATATGAVKFDPGETQNLRIAIGPYGTGLRDGVFFCDNLPASVCERMKHRLKLDPEAMAGEIHAATERFTSHLGSAMFALLPAYAGWLMLMFGWRGRRYTEHLVFALHLHAFWFCMMLLMALPLPMVTGLAVLASLVYPLLALHKVYPMRWWGTLWRSALLALAYLMTVGSTLGVVFVLSLLS
jgi:rRNA maturation protein Nop10